MKLAIAQIVLGVIIVVDCALHFTVTLCLLGCVWAGLAVLGCGIAQLLKARGPKAL
ncbi:hypothetical protein ES708_01945 [subsurface metagenome]|jgi:hypothetical protein